MLSRMSMARCSEARSAASACLRPVRSRAIEAAPMMLRSMSLMGDTLSEISIRRAPFDWRMVLERFNTLPPLQAGEDAGEFLRSVRWNNQRDRAPDRLIGRVAIQ